MLAALLCCCFTYSLIQFAWSGFLICETVINYLGVCVLANVFGGRSWLKFKRLFLENTTTIVDLEELQIK